MDTLSPSTVACLSGWLSAAAVAGGGFLARGTTAVPAAAWAATACLAFAAEMGARAGGGLVDPAAAAAARLAVVSLAVCPAMSLLGAKRPQHHVWQLIVATLAVVLVMPAVSARLVRPGSLPDVHLLERCFMPLLVVVGWLNFIGTRRAAAATAIAAGQFILMRGLLPGAEQRPPSAAADAVDAAAAVLVLAGTTIAVLQAIAADRRRRRTTPPTGASHAVAAVVDPPFLALRETLGAAWTLRIAERFDAVASSRGWPCRLRFTGLDCGGDPDDTAWHRDALRAFRALLRRFVTDGWLARHGCHDRSGTAPDSGEEPS